jgi:uncharacterized protein (TIGR03086 family)
MAMLDLYPAVGEVTRLLDGVGDERLTGPTPCEGHSVATLLDHFMGLSLAFTWAARKTTVAEGAAPGAPVASAEHLDPDWRAVLPKQLGELADAWRDPAAWEGMTEVGGLRMPGQVIGLVALDELVLHGWDLARATGQPFGCDAASAAAVLKFTRDSTLPEHAEGRQGLFGPVVPVPEDAPALDRALGFAGRDPAWAPPA